VKVLRDGGNAVDATIAVASVLAVVYPQMCSIGGDSFWLVWNADARELRALNASGRSGERATRAFYTGKGLDAIPPRGYLAANTVPGILSGWQAAWDYAQASMRSPLAWSTLFEDAIRYAEQGAPVTPSLAHWQTVNCDPNDDRFRHLQRFEGFRRQYLKPDGSPWSIGELLRQPDLAKTLKLLAAQGSKVFYEGEIARAIVADLSANGGLLTLADFAEHRADWVTPLSVPYRDTTAYNFPPNTQGFASLAILNILNHFDVASIPEGSADWYHLLIEATKEAFVDRDRWLTDPEFIDIPLAEILSPARGRAQAARIRMDKAATLLTPLDPHGDTVWFGCRRRPGQCRVADPEHLSRLRLGHRARRHRRAAAEPRQLLFAVRRSRQPPGAAQALLPHAQPGDAVQGRQALALVVRHHGRRGPAADAGRDRQSHRRPWHEPRRSRRGPALAAWPHLGAASNDTKVESRVPTEVTDELARRGHPVRVVDAYTDVMGHAGAILIDPDTGVRHGGSDPRSDGLAAGY
jgi:gamma-glutamyltranspeptidase/glutathione hydrolase